MSQIKLVKFKIKPGKRDAWLNWVDELKKRNEEVLATLKTEGVKFESCLISEDDDCVYYIMVSDDLDKVKNAFEKSDSTIDVKHKRLINECLEPVSKAKELFTFEI